MNSKVTVIPRVYKPDMVNEAELSEVINAIRSGVFRCTDLKSITKQIQSWNDHSKQNELKFWGLPVIMYNGVFTYKRNDRLKEYSSYTAIDFDQFSSEEELQNIGYWLTQTPFVYAVFRTPSGRGLKAIVLHDNTDAKDHDELFSQLLSYFKSPTTDASVSDVSRGNYLVYDPNIWVNPNPIPYHFVHSPSYFPKPKSKPGRIGSALDIWMLQFMLDLKKPTGNKSDESIINILSSHWLKQRKRWQTGNRANYVFQSACELCNAGVKMGLGIKTLQELYAETGLSVSEITYQAQRGYQCNADTFGTTRTRFDRYGSKNRQKS